MKLNPYTQKINSKLRIYTVSEMVKHLDKNIEKELLDIVCGNDFVDMPPKI